MIDAKMISELSSNGIVNETPLSETSMPSIPVAIVGISCKFGGDATSPPKFWDLCMSSKDSWSPIPESRFNAKALYNSDGLRTGRHHVKGGHFFQEDVGLFDAAFFNFSGDVASAMDPQLQLLMESIYEAIENAGIPAESLSGSNTSVFSGIFARDYFDTTITDPELLPSSFITGNGAAMFSNPLHQVVRNVQLGESDLSIVGSSCALLNPDMFIVMSSQNVLSAEGRCFAWDERATGYGRGEGVAALILKRLDDAVRDGDHIHAVIRESGLNQDGKTTTISSPSMEAQRKLIEETYRRAGISLADTAYVEAHMTGTPTGDPIEAEALARTFGKNSATPVIVGSCKPNIGHTEPVSGLAAIIKAAYVLQTGLIPPNVNYEKKNPKIPLDAWNLQVPTTITQWPQNKPRRASVNNFGYGGTNGHIIMEAPPKKALTNGGTNGQNGDYAPASRVFIISSKDSSVTQNASKRLAEYIRETIASGHPPSPTDLAYTLAERRSRFPWAIALRADSIAELAARLEEPERKATRSMRTEPRLGFVFNGQGAQWHAMGRELMSSYPVFQSAIMEADEALKVYGATWSLYDELLRDEKTTRVHNTQLSQPVSIAVQIALVDLLRAWNITPSAVVSHSSGEIAAAYAVGALSFKEALGVAFFRGELALKHQKVNVLSGGMMAAGLSAEKAEDYIKDTANGQVVVACINSPDSITMSGDLSALDEVESRLEKDGIFVRKLKVPLAYHSHHMMHMAQDYTDKLREILPASRTWSGVTFASPVTGNVVTSADLLDPEHWVRNLTSPVLFSPALEQMCFSPLTSDGTTRATGSNGNIDFIVEVGAHGTLAGPIRQILKERNFPYASCLKRNTNAVYSMHDMTCELLTRGYPVDISAANSYGEPSQGKYVQNLPTYAWNHSTRYWNEPRVYRDHRYRKYPPHELLGTSVSGHNQQTPTWRNFLRLQDIPWLEEHRLGTKPVLPGAGYIAMAIDAVRLLTDPSEKTIKGYMLRDVDIMNVLTIPDSSAGVETRFTLRPCSEKELDYKGWYEFDLASVDADGTWIQNARGEISAALLATTTGNIQSSVSVPEPESFLPVHCKVDVVDPESIFADMRKMDIYHGPVFQNLTSCRAAGTKTVADFHISSASVPSENDYVLHPTTLDTIFQSFYVGVPEEVKKDAMVVPRSIRTMFVPRDLGRQAGDKLRAFTSLTKADRRGATSNAIVVNNQEESSEDSFSPLQIDGFYCQGIPRASEDDAESKEPRLCATSHWEPDVLHKIPQSIKNSWKLELTDNEVRFAQRWRRVSYQFIYEAVQQLEGVSDENWQWYHKLFYTWMQSVVARGKTGELAPGSQGWAKTSKGIKQRLIDDLAAENAAGKLTVRVGQKLASIIRGEITPLELMMEGNLLNQYYMESPPLSDRSYKHLRSLAELYGVKYPGAKVLEIGAGTGGATMIVLDGLSARAQNGSGSLLGQYDFTDVSSGFFEAARAKFQGWNDQMNFKKLDIEVDPTEQSFVPNSYDLIVASIVLHATKSLRRTMTNVRKLLKPGGKLLLLENTQDRLDLHLVFGPLPGWWLSEEPDRKMSPNAPLETWDRVLRETGFSGIDFDIYDCEDPDFLSQSVIVSTAEEAPEYPSSVSLVYTDLPSQPWLNELKAAVMSQTGSELTIESLNDVVVQDDRVYIFTAEMTAPFIDSMNSTSFEKLRSLLVSSQGVLWLSNSGLIDARNPIYAQSQGLFRTLKQEDSTKRYVLLDFDNALTPWKTTQVPHIVRVLQASFDYNINPIAIEWEYATKDDLLYVPRFYPDSVQDDACREVQKQPDPASEPFWKADRDLIWHVGQSGLLSDLHFTGVIPSDEIPSGVVEIKAKAFGLNFRDVMVALGQLDETLIGHDCSGIVTRLGPNTERSGLKVGDKVCGIARGRFASCSRAPWTSLVNIPDSMSWEEAASLPIAYATAYITLIDIGRLQRGESLLIHAGTGGVGQAAIMMAQTVGAEVFVTCGTQAKRELLMERYHIPADHIFSSRDTSFSSGIRVQTEGRGVDVVLNSLAGPLLKASWDCIAQFGRFLEIGKVDLEAARRLDLSPFSRSATMAGFDALQYTEYRGTVFHNALTNVVQMFDEGLIQASSPTTSYSILDMEPAMRKMQGGSHIGKLVLVPRTGDEVQVVSRPPPLRLDDPDSTFLITGGLGGIGRAITTWMIEQGARNILITSRRAASHPDAALMLQSAQESGCNLQIRSCDVSDEASLIRMLADCVTTMPSIRGVIQGAMHLDDTVMERMTFEQWQRSTKPKISGTVNLHKHLPNVNFFIMLSSIAGVVGNVSQANYAAGNTFQDALARHRAANGLPALSINLGAVTSVGYVADGDKGLRDRVAKSFGSNVISIDQVLRLIESGIRYPVRAIDQSQVATCIAEYSSFGDETLVKKDIRFKTLAIGNHTNEAAAKASTGDASDGMNELLEALSKAAGEEATALTSAVLINKVAMLFNIATTEIDASLPLSHYGVDSLVAVELRNWLNSAIKAKVTIFEILQTASVSDFASLVSGRSGLVSLG